MKAYLQKLREHHFKLTPRRQAILRIFQEKSRALSPEEIFFLLKTIFKKVGLPSVYRNLETMNSIGILFKVQRPDRRLYYGLCQAKKGEHHHHIVCVECGKIGVFPECQLFDCKEIGEFEILSHSLQLEGLCSQCKGII